MGIITVLSNIAFVIITTSIIIQPVKRIVRYESKCIADYVLALIYLFNCLPVLMDLVIGIPQYKSWYIAFQTVIADETICIIYNFYVLIVMLTLGHYAKKRAFMTKSFKFDNDDGTILVLSRWRTPCTDAIIIVLPFAYVIMKCGITAFIGYMTLSQKGIDSELVSTINQLIMLGLFFCITRYFVQKRGNFASICLVAYTLLAIWINGKRYIIVTVVLMFFYLYQMRKAGEKKRVNLKVVLPVMAIAIVLFSAYYILNVKITSTTDTLYSSLRIDFGRDDVTKFVIKVLLENEPILDYPGQTFLSAIFMLIPRSIWPTKPYPHYRYLTAAIFGTTIYNIPSGMTPSIFEMSLCNFGWIGIPVTIFILIGFCKLGDRCTRLENKLLVLMLITNILTQSLDAALSLLLIMAVNVFLGKVKFTMGSRGRMWHHE